jgi:hypothetical protein
MVGCSKMGALRFVVALLSVLPVACNSSRTPNATAPPTASSKPDHKRRAKVAGTPTAIAAPNIGPYAIPVGPLFGILPGKGIGPIRFGATISTIERLMGAKCTVKTDSLCRYSAQAVDFHLTDGALSKIHIHGDERPFDDNPEHTYGIFNGLFRGDVRLGMYRQYVVEVLGEPERTEKTKPGRFKMEQRDHYSPQKMVLEYDRLKNGNVVLAGVVLEQAPDAPPLKSERAIAPEAPATPARATGAAPGNKSAPHVH